MQSLVGQMKPLVAFIYSALKSPIIRLDANFAFAWHNNFKTHSKIKMVINIFDIALCFLEWSEFLFLAFEAFGMLLF